MSETRTVAIQMDPIDGIDIEADSTFVLALEAQRRGYRLYHYTPKDLVFRDGQVTAHARPLAVRRKAGDHHTLGAAEQLDLAAIDVVLMRQDPPFDMGYITATHILEHIHPRTLVVNDPAHVRNAPEKLLVTEFPQFMPPTLITGNKADIEAFRHEYKDIIVKPLFGNGGAGVFRLQEGDENLASLLEIFEIAYPREPIIVQKYLPAVRQGDKRIILIDGEPAGAINRIPAAGESRSNMHVGGRPVKDTLNARDLEICEAIGPMMRARDLVFVGIDVIGGYLTEINVTSPTGLQEIDRFDGVSLESQIWDAIERRL